MSDTDADDPPSPKSPRCSTSSETSSRSKAMKYSGAYTYKSTFQSSWQRKWPCIKAVQGNVHSLLCTVCTKKLSCKHQGEKDVTRHLQSAGHNQNVKALKETPSVRTSFASSSGSKRINHVVTCFHSQTIIDN